MRSQVSAYMALYYNTFSKLRERAYERKRIDSKILRNKNIGGHSGLHS